MATARVKTRKAHRIFQYGYVFRKDQFVVVSGEKLIKRLKADAQFDVHEVEIEEMAAKPVVEDSFMEFAEPEAPSEAEEVFKPYQLAQMKKAELVKIADECKIRFEETTTKKELIDLILEKQEAPVDEPDSEGDSDGFFD